MGNFLVRLGSTRYYPNPSRFRTHPMPRAIDKQNHLGRFPKDFFFGERVHVVDDEFLAFPFEDGMIGIFQAHVLFDHILRQCVSKLVDDALHERCSTRNFPSVGFNV